LIVKQLIELLKAEDPDSIVLVEGYEIEQYIWGKLNLKSYIKEVELHKQLVRGVALYTEFLLIKV